MNLSDTLRAFADNQTISTIVLFVAIAATRFAANHYVRSHHSADPERRRRILSNIRNALFILTAFGLLFIWAPSLRSFALSLTAFAVAIILATKELILCLSGSFLKASAGEMRVGDWVTVNGMRGEVIDQTLLATTLQELGEGGSRYEFTGRTVTLPNSLFLSAHVINEALQKKFVYHTATIVIDKACDPTTIIDAMTNAIKTAAAADIETALRYKSRMETRRDVKFPDAEPTVHLSNTNEGKVKLMIRALLPAGKATAIEKTTMLAGLEAMRNLAAIQEAEQPENKAS